MTFSKLQIIKHRAFFFFLSGVLIVASIASLTFFGLNFSIDFTGGSLLEIDIHGEHQLTPPVVGDQIKTALPRLNDVAVQPTTSGFLIRTKDLTELEHQIILQIFKDSVSENAIDEKRFESIGPVVGGELKNKAIWAVSIAIIMMVIYIAWAFRKVSKPVASWKYGLGAIIALVHDLIITTGIFSVLGHFLPSFEIDLLFVTAMLTILGYSVNDTIVVYDRTRENLIYKPQETFEATVNKSVNETMTRSINTGMATLFVLLSLILFGGESILSFVLVLFIGVVFGTYSSIFVASTLLVVWYKLGRRGVK
jgi:preprotein translocase subunit SecF